MTFVQALLCIGIFAIGIVIATVPCVIMHYTLKAVINWIKWFIKVHRNFDDDWYDL